MTRPGAVSHYFAGANTPGGFFSRYDQIAPADARKVFILKGGPGTGKSTFMKRIAEELLALGHDVEYFHCSADNQGIDAIYVPAADAAVLDGTAPHVVDPKYPGAVEEIINLGQFWDERALRAPATKERIIRLTRGYKFWFQRANEARRAAQAWLEEWAAYHRACLDEARVRAAGEAIAGELLRGAGDPRRQPDAPPAGIGRARRLFASAITHGGPRSFLGPVFDDLRRRFVLVGPPGTGKKAIVERVVEAALVRGQDADVFHCTMYPERAEHVRLRTLSAGVISSVWPHEYEPGPGDQVVDTGAFVDRSRLAGYGDAIAAAEAACREAIRREIEHLGRAKAVHDELEQCYLPHMDFDGIERVRRETFERILACIAERQAEKP